MIAVLEVLSAIGIGSTSATRCVLRHPQALHARRAVEVLSAIDIGSIPLDQVFHHLRFV